MSDPRTGAEKAASHKATKPQRKAKGILGGFVPPCEPVVVREWVKYRIIRSERRLVVQYNLPTGMRSEYSRSGWLDHCEHDPLPGYVRKALKELKP